MEKEEIDKKFELEKLVGYYSTKKESKWNQFLFKESINDLYR